MSFANQSSGSIRLVGDVVGYTRAGTVTAEGGMAAIPPQRVLDTQTGIGASATPVASRRTITVQVAGRAGVPLMGARAVLLNVTATSAQARGFLTLYAGHYCTPTGVSTVNFAPGRAVANMVLAPLAPDGTVTIYNGRNRPHHRRRQCLHPWTASTRRRPLHLQRRHRRQQPLDV